MKFKKAISLIMVMALSVSVLSVPASAIYKWTGPDTDVLGNRDFSFNLGKGNVLTLIGYNGNSQDVAIPEQTDQIESYVFDHSCCKTVGKIRTITLPASLKSTPCEDDPMYANMFIGFTSLKAIYVRPGSNTYSSSCGVLFSKDGKKLVQYPVAKADKSYRVPRGVKRVDSCSFIGANNLTTVAIESGVTSIGCSAFSTCKNLKSVYIPASVTSIGNDVFSHCWYDVTVYGKKGSYAEKWVKTQNFVIFKAV